MIKTLTATTRELDDAQDAIAEITEALDLGNSLLKHSLGIIACYSEFGDTGVLEAICEALPFDCIGTTTCLSAAEQEIDQMLLVITVLTSDDCTFRTAAFPMKDKPEDDIYASTQALLEQAKEKPALLLGYFPLGANIGVDQMLVAIDKATGGIPVFGTVVVDHTMDYSTSRTIHNGAMLQDEIVLAAICGPVNVSFDIASLNEDKIRKQKAIITESDGNLLLGVNGKTVKDYLDELGLKQAELGMGIVPFVIGHQDGTRPVARAVYSFTPEGHAVCGGSMPEGATLAIGRVDAGDVLQTAEEAAAPLAAKDKGDSVVFIYSCLARYLALGVNVTTEAETIRDACPAQTTTLPTAAAKSAPCSTRTASSRTISTTTASYSAN